MRHSKNHGMKLGSDASHTKAMKRSLVNSLLLNDRIRTTETRAKAIRGDVDRVITWAKKGDLHSRRLALAKLNDKEVVREVFDKASQGMWADRASGFTRIIKLGPRKGDNAPIVIMELVTEPVKKKTKKAKPVKKTEVKAAPAEAEESLEEVVAEDQATEEVAQADAPVADTAEEAPAADEASSEDEAPAAE